MSKLYRKPNGNIWKGVAAGLIGGLVATWTMTQFQQAWSNASKVGSGSNGKADAASEEKSEDATMKTAGAISETVFGQKLSKPQKEAAGPLVHYAFGTMMGGVYGLAAEVSPVAKSIGGLPFGTALFVGADEIAVPGLKLSKPPNAYPASRHLFGLSSHLVWAGTTELVRRLVLRVL